MNLNSLRDVLKNSTRFAWRRLEARVGRLRDVRAQRQVLRTLPSIEESIARVQGRWEFETPPSSSKPIFILSAGWRSGSTMLQRLVLTSGEVLIWGEPYDHCDFTRHLADPLKAFTDDWPPESFIATTAKLKSDEALSGKWVASLYPDPAHLLRAQRSFFETLYAEPAAAIGYSRWGFKEVRLSLDYAIYLKWLFPDARFLFLVRNPYNAYRSYRIFRNWYDRWPNERVLSPAHFGRVWRSLADGFVSGHEKVGGLLIQYEDLIEGRFPIDRIADYLELDLSDDALGKRVSGRGRVQLEEVPAFEQRHLARQVEPLASRLGYSR